MLLVVPSDPLKPRHPDEHFADEYEAAATLGIDTALVDHDALVAGASTAAVERVPDSPDVVYRGWMLSSSQYGAFEAALVARGAALRTTATAYRAAHELPGWIASVHDLTAEMLWTETDSLVELDTACALLGRGPAVLRDWVKSAKHHWDEAVFIPDVSDRTRARGVATRLRELRGDDFTGGFVVRRFEEYPTAEVRTWWVDGRCALATAHPDTPDSTPEDYTAPPTLDESIAHLGLRFVTVDLARRVDGEWRVIEVGDGQVSDRPPTADPADLLSALADIDVEGGVPHSEAMHVFVTIKQAAAILGVSAPMAKRLVEAGRLPAQQAGNHRHLDLGVVLAYREASDAERGKALSEMSEDAEALGLYD